MSHDERARKSAAVFAYTARKMESIERRLERLEALLANNPSRHQDPRLAEEEKNDDARGPRS